MVACTTHALQDKHTRDHMNNYMHLAGRILLAIIFVLSGFGKLGNPAGTAGYMQAMGVPTILLWPTVALELLGGIAIVIGFQTRWVALALAAFSVISAAIFHSNFADQMQMIHFLKNLAIAGGFLLLASTGATALSIDSRKK
ncbi:DoxX family protein [Uliginosibacterium sp. H3]|uniref:DoxX family protein n=1 Tax=Uliginosibacterium silvisoli TaxID=3114758 RepID=A0ABU6JZK6_9RHOO|nr:DoxX family protein [Uliginosibacterium sp. H3]